LNIYKRKLKFQVTKRKQIKEKESDKGKEYIFKKFRFYFGKILFILHNKISKLDIKQK
jgi:hypothetical protein